MVKPLKIERIGDMFQLLWLESVITEASLMTRNIKLPSVFMNWMCFHCRVGGAKPPSQNLEGLGGQRPPAKIFRKNEKKMFFGIHLFKSTFLVVVMKRIFLRILFLNVATVLYIVVI